MPLKAILFLVSFVAACGLTLYMPLVGVVGYMMHYQVYPERQWWGQELANLSIRYSFTLALLTAVALAIHFRQLRYGRAVMKTQEWLLVAFVALVWLSTLWSMAVQDASLTGQDPPEVKMTKVLIFVLMLTHIVTTLEALNALMWAFVVGALWLGYDAYTAGQAFFNQGRLDAIGGPDFSDANAFACYLAACLPIIGVQFLRSRWIGRVICTVAGVLAVNAMVLTRSRGAMVALAGGMLIALLAAPKGKRWIILAAVIVLAIGGYSLTDPGFWERAKTIAPTEGQWESSAQGRVDIWRAALDMFCDHPLGVGARGFLEVIGLYDPARANRDAHNTFILCACELGFQGTGVFLMLLIVAVATLRSIYRKSRSLPKAQADDFALLHWAFAISLGILVVGGLTVTLLYVEGVYWFLALPVCLERCLENREYAQDKVPKRDREVPSALAQARKA